MIGLVVGCGSGAGVSTGSSVAEVKVTRDADRVQILGLDARHLPVGEIIVRLADYVDIESLDPTPVHGRLIAATVGTLTVTHQAPVQTELQLPLIESRLTPDFVAFMIDPQIDAALTAERVRAHVVDLEALRPAPVASQDEQAFLTCTFGASTSCGTGNCYQYAGTDPIQHRCCTASAQAVERLCTGNPGGTNSCGPVGSFGCSVCPGYNTFAYTGTCRIDPTGNIWDQGTHCNSEGSQCTYYYECCTGVCQGPDGQKTCAPAP